MFINKIAYVFLSIIIFSLSLIEFFKIMKRIFKNNSFKNFIFNSFFSIYMFLFLLIFILGTNDVHFKIILFIILIICSSSDIGGLIIGKMFKGPKLTKISPNKTITGSLGSILFSILISSTLLKYLFNTSSIQNILIGLVVSISVQLGDLFFSYLKRKSSIKNTGNLLPGHGGILDRIDGILLGLPIGLTYILILIFKV